jgi:hypothetical protein
VFSVFTYNNLNEFQVWFVFKCYSVLVYIIVYIMCPTVSGGRIFSCCGVRHS